MISSCLQDKRKIANKIDDNQKSERIPKQLNENK